MTTWLCGLAGLSALLFLTACAGTSSGPNTAVSAPAITLSTLNVDFGPQTLSVASLPTALTISNSGGAPLTISSITIGGSNAAAFSIANNNCGTSLAPGARCVVNVIFTPGNTNSAAASLTITDNAGNSPQTVGLSGSGFTVSGLAHGMFVLDPPGDDTSCANGYPTSCYTQHLVPTLICSGAGTPVGYNCTQPGAGEPYVKGAVFHVSWSTISSANGTYDFSNPDQSMQPWIDSGKVVGLVFEAASFGTTNTSTPTWYSTAVNIASVSQTGGIIALQTSTPMGFFPGGIGAAAGLEIQIAGTGTALDGDGTSANPGLWIVCDHTTAGCQDPSAQTVYAIGSGSDIATISQGTVGNPMYGSNDGSTCSSGIIPIEWRPNFIMAWQSFMGAAIAHYNANPNVAYLRFGLGIGGQTNPTYGSNEAACQAVMTTYGFTSVPAPWPAPGSSQWSQVTANWIAYLKTMLLFEHAQAGQTSLITTTSPLEFSGGDVLTPDATASAAVADNIGFGDQGLSKTDPVNFANGQPCGGDWCANFQKFKGKVPLELQTLSYSDPNNDGQTGSLAPLLPFATGLGTQILELYLEDWMCTYDASWANLNAYAACNSAGYPAVFSTTAKQIN